MPLLSACFTAAAVPSIFSSLSCIQRQSSSWSPSTFASTPLPPHYKRHTGRNWVTKPRTLFSVGRSSLRLALNFSFRAPSVRSLTRSWGFRMNGAGVNKPVYQSGQHFVHFEDNNTNGTPASERKARKRSRGAVRHYWSSIIRWRSSSA